MNSKEKIYYVYIITNLITNKQYVGSHICYKNCLDNYMGSSKYLNEDYKLYGIENFSKQILKDNYINKIDLLNGESEFILKFNALSPNGYNRFLPNKRLGFSMTGVPKKAWNKGLKLTEDQKKNMKKPKSKEHAIKVGLTKIGNKNMKGKHHTERTKELMRKAKLGTKHSKEHNNNFSKSRKGVPITPTQKILCLYCNKTIDKRNFSRWHGEKCKSK